MANLLLTGIKASNEKIKKEGFVFQQTTLKDL